MLRIYSGGIKVLYIPSMSEIAIREKMNGQDRTRLNGSSIGLENTVDYAHEW
jgi:hypothetical protein